MNGLSCAHEENHPASRPHRTPRLRCEEAPFILSELESTRQVLFCTDTVWQRHEADVRKALPLLDTVLLEGDDIVSESDLARITIAFFSGDAWPGRTPRFIYTCLHAPMLQWLHTFSAGVDSPVFGDFLRRGVRLTTSSGSSARPIAQTVALMMLSLSRDMPAWLRAQQARRWEPHVGEELEGANLAIIGMGPIGRETARIAATLGMNVIGCRRAPTGDEPCPTRSISALPELLAWADWIVLAVPLTNDTRGMIGTNELALMKPTARLINVGRGLLVDEAALIDALANKRLAGAGLDVFEVEPLPADSALWDMPNVIITPHNSGATLGANARATDIFLDNLGRFGRGETLRNEVRLDDVGAAPIAR